MWSYPTTSATRASASVAHVGAIVEDQIGPKLGITKPLLLTSPRDDDPPGAHDDLPTNLDVRVPATPQEGGEDDLVDQWSFRGSESKACHFTT